MDSNSFWFTFEPIFMHWLQAHLGVFGKAAAIFFTYLSEPVSVIALMCLLYWCIDKEKGKKIGEILLLATVFNTMVKNLFMRRRPYMVHDNVECLRAPEPRKPIHDIAAQSFSFPSGHSTNSAVMFSSFRMLKKHRMLTILAVVAPILVALSRVALGVHYPTDVLCGLAIGYLTLGGMIILDKKVKKKAVLRMIFLALSMTGFLFCGTEDYYTSVGSLAGIYAGFAFEERFVGFENTRKPIVIIIRFIVGIALYGLLDVVLKLPFDKAFLESGTTAAFAVRSARYFVVVFLLIGVYPMAFRIGEKKHE